MADKEFKLYECTNTKGDRRLYFAITPEAALDEFHFAGFIRKVGGWPGRPGLGIRWPGQYSSNVYVREVNRRWCINEWKIVDMANQKLDHYVFDAYHIIENGRNKDGIPQVRIGGLDVEVPHTLEELRALHKADTNEQTALVARYKKWWEEEKTNSQLKAQEIVDLKSQLMSAIQTVLELDTLSALMRDTLAPLTKEA